MNHFGDFDKGPDFRLQIAQALNQLERVRTAIQDTVRIVRDQGIDLALLEGELFVEEAISSLTKAEHLHRHREVLAGGKWLAGLPQHRPD